MEDSGHESEPSEHEGDAHAPSASEECPRYAEPSCLGDLLKVAAILLVLVVTCNLLTRPPSNVQDAYVAAAKAQVKALIAAVENYQKATGEYPSTLNDLVDNSDRNYLDAEAVPLDPWGNPYVHTCPGGGGRPFDIVSLGADGQPGGEDADILSWDL